MTKMQPFSDAEAASARTGAGVGWLAAFLLLLGIVLATPTPSTAVAGNPQLQGGKSAQGDGAADKAHRDAIRAPASVIRALLAKDSGGGKGMLPVGDQGAVVFLTTDAACPRDARGGSGISARGFNARAPPVLTA